MSLEGLTSNSLRWSRCTKVSKVLWDDRLCPQKHQGGTSVYSEGKRNEMLFRHQGASKSSAVFCKISAICYEPRVNESDASPRSHYTPGWAGGGELADGCWRCLSVQKTRNEKSVPLSTADLLMTASSQLGPRAQHTAGALSAQVVSAPELAWLSRAECRLLQRLSGLDPAYDTIRQQNSWKNTLMSL